MGTVTVETYTDGKLVASKTVQTDPASDARDTVYSKARQALAANATFLAFPSPSAAQIAAQVKALTRQTNALIRLMLNALDDVSDT